MPSIQTILVYLLILSAVPRIVCHVLILEKSTEINYEH